MTEPPKELAERCAICGHKVNHHHMKHCSAWISTKEQCECPAFISENQWRHNPLIQDLIMEQIESLQGEVKKLTEERDRLGDDYDEKVRQHEARATQCIEQGLEIELLKAKQVSLLFRLEAAEKVVESARELVIKGDDLEIPRGS